MPRGGAWRITARPDNTKETSMNLLPIAAVAGAFALGGCSSVPSLFESASIAQSAPAATADAEKALTIAHLAYQAAGVSLAQAAQSGTLSGADAAKAQALFDQAGTALDIADQADALANAQGMLAAVADAQTLIAQLDTIIDK
jgi:hypothetical protein